MKTIRALIAEDSPDDYELLVRALRRGGYDAHCRRVETEQQLTNGLDHEAWDIVFSDWSMPSFSAQAALAVLRRRALDIPFIIVSGTVGEEIAVTALRNGAHDFLVKSRLARLIPAVERELRDAELRKERHTMHEQLLVSERMASVGILAAGVGHEINNPLASVIGNLEFAVRDLGAMYRRGGEPTELREILEELHDAQVSAGRIRDIVRDLRLFSRADDERTGPVDVEKVIESCLRMAWAEIRHRARVIKRFAPVPPVEANESRLAQVFVNLIVNAAQAIPDGRAQENEIVLTTQQAPNNRVLIEVSDTGSGMPPHVLKQLFRPFFTTKEVGSGTGLGLSICHRIVTTFGGQISVESTPGKGTSFRVLLPASDRAAQRSPALEATPLAEPGRRGRILHVDDEPLMATVVQKTLSAFHDVVSVDRADEALAMIRAGERFDLILCDLLMPEMTGMDLHAELVQISSDQATKMVFLTGGAFTARARSFLGEVANPRIEKPFLPAELRAFVNERLAVTGRR